MVPFALIALDWRYPLLTLDEPISAAVIQLACWFLPWIAFAAVLRQPLPKRQLLGLLSLSPLLLFSLIAIPWSLGDISTVMQYRQNLEFTPIARLNLQDGSQLVTYIQDCGFVCGPVAVLRQERTLVGPLRIVHFIAARDGEELCVDLVDNAHVRVEGTEYRLRPFILF